MHLNSSLPVLMKYPLLSRTPRGGSTQTGLALKYVLRKGFPGGRNSSHAAQIVIVLSDGKSQGNVMQAAAQLKEAGVVLFAVGLRYPRYALCSENSDHWLQYYTKRFSEGEQKVCFSRWEELHAMASEPVENHVFFAEHFYDAVNGLYTTLATFSVCSATPQGQPSSS